MAYGRKGGKRGGLVGNLAKLGGANRKLSLKTDMRPESMHGAGNITLKKASKQAHKRV